MPDGPAWLRVASAPQDQLAQIFWDGAVEAEGLIPPSVPRPGLRRWYDWAEHGWVYRGELYEHVAADTVATHAAINAPPKLSSTWWTAVRGVLATVSRVSTARLTVRPEFLAWAMPHYLGTSPSDHPQHPWSTAHGDFHFANLCAPALHVLDWEGWGLAPPGYDAATLHTYSLLTPSTATEVNRELTHLLNTPAGRYAELVIITELLYAAEQGANATLAGPLRRRAASLLLGMVSDNTSTAAANGER